jgi:hypothetical protein
MKNGLSTKDFAVKFLDPWNAHDTQAFVSQSRHPDVSGTEHQR